MDRVKNISNSAAFSLNNNVKKTSFLTKKVLAVAFAALALICWVWSLLKANKPKSDKPFDQDQCHKAIYNWGNQHANKKSKSLKIQDLHIKFCTSVNDFVDTSTSHMFRLNLKVEEGEEMSLAGLPTGIFNNPRYNTRLTDIVISGCSDFTKEVAHIISSSKGLQRLTFENCFSSFFSNGFANSYSEARFKETLSNLVITSPGPSVMNDGAKNDYVTVVLTGCTPSAKTSIEMWLQTLGTDKKPPVKFEFSPS